MSFHKLSVLEGKVVSDLQCMNIVWDLLCGFIARNSSKASRCLVVELGKVGCELDLQPKRSIEKTKETKRRMKKEANRFICCSSGCSGENTSCVTPVETNR